MKRAFVFSTLIAAAPVMAQTTTTATNLPANVQADLATLKQDAAALRAAAQQLRSDEATNIAAVPADRSLLALARLQLRVDMRRVHEDAAPMIQADETALHAALTQLHGDQVANNTGALAADQAAVMQAEEQLRADAKALHAGFGEGGRWRGHR